MFEPEKKTKQNKHLMYSSLLFIFIFVNEITVCTIVSVVKVHMAQPDPRIKDHRVLYGGYSVDIALVYKQGHLKMRHKRRK